MRLTGTENPNIWDKEIDITLTIREFQIIRDCLAKSSYSNIVCDYKNRFNIEPQYSDSDMYTLYMQAQKILKEEGGYTETYDTRRNQ